MAQVHMLLAELNGTRFLLCDTRGRNLSSTRNIHDISAGIRCLRCVNRWNMLAKLADGDSQKMKSFLNIELADKIERSRHDN